jgi:hypothetical protein
MKAPRYLPDQKIDDLIDLFNEYVATGPNGPLLGHLHAWGIPALYELKERRRLEDLDN